MSARTTPPNPAPARAPRDARIEALRLVAIAGIAVFHTFQPWFAAATDGSWDAGAPTLWALGMISLLGAFGNHVFFMVSGLFLVPGATAAARRKTGWRSQATRTARRALTILASVALYAALALATSAWVTPVDGVGLDQAGWLLGGLEFIWVYLALVVATPVMGRVWARMRRPEALVGALAVAVFAVNAYIAFVSPGEAERGLLEWRKLMSAVSYLVAYLVGGALGARRTRVLAEAHGSAAVAPRIGLLGSRCPLAAALAVSAGAEAVTACSHNLGLLAALSFKSTSALSFALAVGAVCAVAAPLRREGQPGPSARAVRWLTPAILGYYIAQSLFSGLWRPAFESVCAGALDAGGPIVLLATGIAASVALLVVALVADRLVRVNLLRQVHLS